MHQKKLRNSVEYAETANRYVYNRVRKLALSKEGKIRCGFCPYHKNENQKAKGYGGHQFKHPRQFHFKGLNYPSWKLVSKNRKQWMPNNVKKIVRPLRHNYGNWVSFEF